MEREKRVANGQKLDSRDRLSELPDFILHNVLSFLDAREACRTTTLSKRWLDIWGSNPVLDFRPEYFKKKTLDSRIDESVEEYYDEGFLQNYVGFIDYTMQRYNVQKHAIHKLRLDVPKADEKLVPMIDQWLEVAVHNKVEELVIYNFDWNSGNYRLPEILFAARSLKVLRCFQVEVPYYPTMKLTALQYLEVRLGVIDFDCETWPSNTNVGALSNLRTLKISDADVSDATLENLVYKLDKLETLVLASCNMLKCINISSSQLKNLELVLCRGLKGVTLNAPHLVSFRYSGSPDISLSMTCPEQCDSHFRIESTPQVSSAWLIKMKKFLKETNFKVLEVDLLFVLSKIEFDEDEMMSIDTGSPSDVKVLKLLIPQAGTGWFVAFLDGLLWCCHPEVLYVVAELTPESQIVESLLNSLKKTKSGRHPLKRIETKPADWPCRRTGSMQELWFVLHW